MIKVWKISVHALRAIELESPWVKATVGSEREEINPNIEKVTYLFGWNNFSFYANLWIFFRAHERAGKARGRIGE